MIEVTNNQTEYFNRILKKMANTPTKEATNSIRFQFIELPYSLQYGFSIYQLENTPNLLYVKTLDSPNSQSEGIAGLYTLNNISTQTHKLILSTKEQSDIDQCLNAPLKNQTFDGIVLDGYHREFKHCQNSIYWNIDDQINSNLQQLTNLLRNKIDRLTPL